MTPRHPSPHPSPWTARPRRSAVLRQRLHGLVAALLLVVVVAGVPVLLVAIGAVPSPSSFGWSSLTSPDDGTVALAVVGVVAWLAWIVFTACLTVEAAARLRGVRPPRIPGLGMPQLAAGRLVALASLLFVAIPVMTQTISAPPATATPAVQAPAALIQAPATLTEAPPSSPQHQRTSLTPAPAVRVTGSATDPATVATVAYTTRRGDSLWRIAERWFGDPRRYKELEELNHDVLGDDPDFLPIGLVLRLPVLEAHTAAAGTHVDIVEPDQTLSQIAQDELGDASDYMEIFDASRHAVQPDGEHLSDPDLIRPGWELTIPGAEVDNSPVVDPPVRRHSPMAGDHSPVVAPGGKHVGPPSNQATSPLHTPIDTPTETPDDSSMPSTPTPTAHPSNSPVANPSVETQDNDNKEAPAGWLLPGLAGAGALLAGAVLVAVRAHRRTQQRHRRPGLAIAPPPPRVRAVEKTITVTGAPTAEVVGQLDRLLRHLAANSPVVPMLDAIEVNTRTVTLHLAQAADLPDPWSGREATWSAGLDSPVGEEDQLSPYPLLASVGRADDGGLWLLDLERLGSIALTGDPAHAQALARHLAAELTLSPWAVIAEIDTLDIASELAALDPGRLRHHTTDDDTEFLDRLYADLDRALQAGHGEPEPFRTLLAADTMGATDEQVRALADLVRTQSSRSGFALVTLLTPADSGDALVELTSDGRLQLPELGLDLAAAGLTAAEAEACAAIVDLTRGTTLVPMPRQQADGVEVAAGWRALADQAGALVSDLTEQRPAGEAGGTSLLPEAAGRYEAVAATTAEDIETLAPIAPEKARTTVEDVDPQLDADLAGWRDPDSPLPKLRLLGPVTVIAKGTAPTAVAERKAYFTELVTFLALHPSGVSSRQVRGALGMTQSRARTDLGYIRTWFDTNPRTGELHLPPATTSPAHRDRGTSGYQLNGVLVDLDLFRRLRARAQARGAGGMTDLVTALELVSGEPFSVLRDPGWSWLLDDERIHETATFAIVDVAHLVAADALSRGDLARARFAAQTGCTAAPYDEICRLDLAKVTEAEGHGAWSEQILHEHVFNRTDDHLPPIDLPSRTAEVVKNHGWDHPKRPKTG